MMRKPRLTIKRVYETPADDIWSKDIAPSADLRKWFDHKPASRTCRSGKRIYTLARNVADGTKNSVPVTALLTSRMRSWLPGGLPMNMLTSIRSMRAGERA